MADKSATPEVMPEDPATPPAAPVVPPKRSPGHRGADVKDTVAEMTAKAHEISLEAGSKMAAAMKDVINAAAGITGFVLESARDLVQYMVRRGQMTQEEADKLIRQAEEAQANRGSTDADSDAPSSNAPSPSQLATDEDDNAARDDDVSGDHAQESAENVASSESSSGETGRPAAKPASKQAPSVAKSAAPAAKPKPATKKAVSAPATAAKKGTTKGK